MCGNTNTKPSEYKVGLEATRDLRSNSRFFAIQYFFPHDNGNDGLGDLDEEGPEIIP